MFWFLKFKLLIIFFQTATIDYFQENISSDLEGIKKNFTTKGFLAKKLKISNPINIIFNLRVCKCAKTCVKMTVRVSLYYMLVYVSL